MAYARTWDDSAPPDGRDADEIGAAIRELRVDIHQRMDTFFTDFDLDPLVPNADYSGAATDRPIMIPHFQFLNDTIDQVDPGDTYLQLTAISAGTGRIPVLMPVGYTITEFAAWVLTTTADVATMSLRFIDVTTGALTNVSGDIATIGDGTIKNPTSGVLSQVVSDVMSFFIKIELDSNNTTRYFGSRLKITKTNNSQGL